MNNLNKLNQSTDAESSDFSWKSLYKVAGITISLVMLRGKIFSKVNAFAGILGFVLLLIHEICSSFVSGSLYIAMIFAMGGGLLSMTWYIMLSRGFFQLGRL